MIGDSIAVAVYIRLDHSLALWVSLIFTMGHEFLVVCTDRQLLMQVHGARFARKVDCTINIFLAWNLCLSAVFCAC